MNANIWDMTVQLLPKRIDREEVRRMLALMVDPDASHEIRALPSGKSRTIHGRDLDGAVRAVDEVADGRGTYITLNPVSPSLKGAARVRDVIRRRHFLIDCDRSGSLKERTGKESNATEEEKEATRQVVERIAADLTLKGWPRPIVVDSGNGWHLLYAIDLPNDKLSQQLLSRCLKALQETYGTDRAEIDTKVHNASRITKLAGTWVRKGPDAPDRPHRMARLVSVPTAIVPVPDEMLRELAGFSPTPGEDLDREPSVVDWTMTVGTGQRDMSSYVRKAIESECGKVSMAPEGHRNHTLNSAAFSLGQLVHLAVISRTEMENALSFAARRAGLGDDEIAKTIRSGLDAGMELPRPVVDRSTVPPGTPAPPPIPVTTRLTVRASQIRPKAVRWLWNSRVPIGFITIFAGRSGLGKSFVTCDFAARITQGEDLPDGPSGLQGECRNVLFISEDPYEYVLAPRLVEMGADLSRISFLTWEAMAAYTLSDTEFLDRAFTEADDPALVVIDPPTNFLGDGIDEHKNSAVRAILMHLVQWVKDKDAACVMITHVNKSSGKGIDAINRVIGSVAWTTTARIAHSFAPDPDTSGDCMFLPIKSNLGQLPKGLGYRIKSTDTLAVVEWTGEVDLSADEAMAGEKRKPRRVVASEWLAEQFRVRREWISNEITDAGKEHGISRNALWEAKGCLPIDARKRMTADGEPVWYWVARPDWPPAES